MNSSRNHHVYTPGSVDSWDMENLKFLRKISHTSHTGTAGGGRELDTMSYVSDSESAVFVDNGGSSVISEDEDKGYLSMYNNNKRDQHDDLESDCGMSSTGCDLPITPTPGKLLDEALYSGGNGFALLNKTIVMRQMKSMAASTLKDPYLEDDVESEPIQPTVIRKNTSAGGGGGGGALTRKPSRAVDDITNFDRRFMKSRKKKPSLVTVGFMEPQLEDCYLLDVMTIRNESVLAERGRIDNRHCLLSSDSLDSENEGIEKVLKMNGRRNGSAGLPSSSSSSVSSEEFNSAREGSYYPSPGDDDEPIEIHGASSPEGTRASSCSPVSVVVRGECANRFGYGYPQSSERSFATASSNYYYLGQGQQQEEFEPLLEETPCPAEREEQGKESLRMLETPRSVSPYYVRLRRDLIPPSYTPPHPRQPWNFGMNRQGLLVIDYSPNWDGLESYVRSLSLQN